MEKQLARCVRAHRCARVCGATRLLLSVFGGQGRLTRPCLRDSYKQGMTGSCRSRDGLGADWGVSSADGHPQMAHLVPSEDRDGLSGLLHDLLLGCPCPLSDRSRKGRERKA